MMYYFTLLTSPSVYPVKSLSGYKIILHKSLLVPLNASAKYLMLPAIHIFSGTTQHSFYILRLLKITKLWYIKYKLWLSQTNIQRWSNRIMPGRISIIKMNVLGRLNFLFSMIPMPLPAKYVDELYSLSTKFILIGKRSRIRLIHFNVQSPQGVWQYLILNDITSHFR